MKHQTAQKSHATSDPYFKTCVDDSIDAILFNNRCIYLAGDIDDTMAFKVCKQITSMSILNKDNINIYINSPGGEVEAGIMIMDCMRMCESQITTIVSGLAASMAGFIAIAGHVRHITPMSWFMAHDSAYLMDDYRHVLKDRFSAYKRMEKQLDEYIETKTQLTRGDILKSQRGELWLDAYQCIEKGICEKIV